MSTHLALDALISIGDLSRLSSTLREMDSIGFSRMWMSEMDHDIFVALGAASQHVSRAEMGTDVAIAFARTPMSLAYAAWDVHALTNGRLVLGLGSQVRGNIERRFGMPWSKPAQRMREFVLAVRAIWETWQHGVELDFRGEFYRHTLMQPAFNPGPLAAGPPRLVLGGVGPLMVETAGEVADGLVMHACQTERTVESITLAALDRGLERSKRSRSDIEITNQLVVATDFNDAGIAAARERARGDFAFYASTPAYAVILEAEGLEDLYRTLHQLSRQRRWDELASHVTDEVLETFIPCGTPEEVLAKAVARSAWADRLLLLPAFETEPNGPSGESERMLRWHQFVVDADRRALPR